MGDLAEDVGERPRLMRVVLVSPDGAATPPQPVLRDLALRFRDAGLTGALVTVAGGWLLWIEGPGAEVCARVPALAGAPWQAGARLLAVGWVERRRFARWPMGLADLSGELDLPQAETILRAARIFDDLAQDHARGFAARADLLRLAADFASCLAEGADALVLPALARADLRARAGFAEAILQRLGRMQAAGRIGSAEVTLALARLNGLLQRAGRLSQPMWPRGRVCLVIPPGETEVIGAIVKADLLRDAGVSVRVVIETTTPDIVAALRRDAEGIVIVTGPRLEAAPRNGRPERLRAELCRRFPDRLILAGGLPSGPLADCVERLALLRHQAGLVPVSSVDWAALGALAGVITTAPQGASQSVFC